MSSDQDTTTGQPFIDDLGRSKILVRRILREVSVVIPPSKRHSTKNSKGHSQKSKRSKNKFSSSESEYFEPSSASSSEEEPEFFSPTTGLRRRNLVISSDESDNESFKPKSGNIPAISSSNNSESEREPSPQISKASKIKETLLRKKKKKTVLAKSESGDSYQDNSSCSDNKSSENEENFVVEEHNDEEEGLYLLPELFSREQSFRSSFDIFIKALIKTNYNPSYLVEIKKTDFDTYTGFQQILSKAKSYCADLAKSHSWTSDYLTALYTYPKCSSEIMVSAEVEDLQNTLVSFSLTGTPYKYSTLEPFSPNDESHCFVIPERSYQDSLICHRLYHFHRHTLDNIALLAEKITLKKDSDEKPIKRLFKMIKNKDLIPKWFTSFEALLDESAKRSLSKSNR